MELDGLGVVGVAGVWDLAAVEDLAKVGILAALWLKKPEDDEKELEVEGADADDLLKLFPPVPP